jgi:transcriptional antiterminator
VASLYSTGAYDFAEIGRILNITRQQVRYDVKKITQNLHGDEDERKRREKIQKIHESFWKIFYKQKGIKSKH